VIDSVPTLQLCWELPIAYGNPVAQCATDPKPTPLKCKMHNFTPQKQKNIYNAESHLLVLWTLHAVLFNW